MNAARLVRAVIATMPRMTDVMEMLKPALVAWTAGATALYFCRTRLRPHAFDQSPRRLAGLQPVDILIGLIVMVGSGVVLLPMAYRAMGWPLDGKNISAEQTGWMRLTGQLLTQGPVVAWMLFRAGLIEGGVRALGFQPRHIGRELAAGALSLLAAMPIVIGVNAIFMLLAALLQQEQPDPIAHEMLRDLMDTPEPLAVALMVVSAVVVAPILEEAIFRGLVQTALQETTGYSMRWMMVIASGGIFCFIHASVVEWQALPGLWALGIILGWLYERHGSLLPGIVLHMLFNTANIGIAIAIRAGQAATPPAG